MDDAMIFGEGGSSSSSSTDKVLVNGANSGGASIDFGVEDRMKNRSPQLHHGRPACNKSSSATTTGDSLDASASPQSEAADVSPSSVDFFIDQPDWSPLVNESQCQSYGPSQFCENVTNYPAEAISKILMSENGSILKTFLADNTAQPIPSASESDESMVLAQRKPGGAPAVTAHAINTRTKPLESGNVQHLCESMTEFKFPKSAKNNQNEMLTIVNQDNISQPITVETCRNENQPCKYADNFPAGYKSFCMQKYVTHHLAALKNGKIVREAFTFPSCCVCVLKLWDARTNSAAEARGIAMPSSLRRMASEVDVQQSP
ncbi:hypothetical protein DAPPUDRAFT_311125 [Daphnia pulex]|uniref:Spaetzle domain-containing protein n=1 Tax=Daphnia pulex TaxID=6669 RepID=E9FUR2_DAPPU|nr:hypothetical protein DAPPUDRAFT_311125 [Daphnia pulex]|eukprot:EFX88879.1 hypothetical protein DAPPUDRAFT_311125 [Daphnia pulex]